VIPNWNVDAAKFCGAFDDYRDCLFGADLSAFSQPNRQNHSWPVAVNVFPRNLGYHKLARQNRIHLHL
jgi:hypothetical protein